MKHKLKERAGLTLVEMLCAMLILSLMGFLLHAGLSMAMQSYLHLTAEAETQIQLNSLTNAIAAELRYAHGVSGDADPTYNGDCRITLESRGHICAGDRELLPAEKDGAGGAYHGEKYSAAPIAVGVPIVQYADGCFTVNLKVVWNGHAVSAQTPEGGVVIRCLNPPEETEEGGEAP